MTRPAICVRNTHERPRVARARLEGVWIYTQVYHMFVGQAGLPGLGFMYDIGCIWSFPQLGTRGGLEQVSDGAMFK